MSLKVAPGRLDLSATSIVCELRDGETRLVCSVSREALRDLGDYYRLTGSAEAVFSELLPEIERLASAKFAAGGVGEDGELRIGTADLLRFCRVPLSTSARIRH